MYFIGCIGRREDTSLPSRPSIVAFFIASAATTAGAAHTHAIEPTDEHTHRLMGQASVGQNNVYTYYTCILQLTEFFDSDSTQQAAASLRNYFIVKKYYKY